MTVTPAAVTSTIRHFYSWLRALAYNHMAQQASGWAPGATRVAEAVDKTKPIKIDFKIAKKSRLIWSSRHVQHLPHLVMRKV